MAFLTVKKVKCDFCGCTREVADLAAPNLPKGWDGASDFYGNELHCCDKHECHEWFRAEAPQMGFTR